MNHLPLPVRFEHPVIPIGVRTLKDGKQKLGVLPSHPGMIVERCGKQYVVDEHGTQRRIKEK